jgi:large subunit ribosomal protein L25
MKTFDIMLKKREAKDPEMLLAVLYGHGIEGSLPCMTHKKDFIKLAKSNGRNIILNCILEDKKTIPALIKDIQKDVMTLEPLHLDLLAVSLDQEITIKSKVTLSGESIGVKNGGNLQQSTFQVELKGKPLSLPETIVIDISSMDMGTQLKAGDLNLGDGVSLVTSEHDTILTIQAPRVEMVGGTDAPQGEAVAGVAPASAPGKTAAKPAGKSK